MNKDVKAGIIVLLFFLAGAGIIYFNLFGVFLLILLFGLLACGLFGSIRENLN